jgi:hypothetical protein
LEGLEGLFLLGLDKGLDNLKNCIILFVEKQKNQKEGAL